MDKASSFDPKSLTGAQLRAARALADMTVKQLSGLTKLGVNTLLRAEKEHGTVKMTPANAERVVSALETAGVEFLAENGGGAGVRFRQGS
jgi:formate-dependent phosphoribosylglycinamide formyltransferase (GAR transformylase)